MNSKLTPYFLILIVNKKSEHPIPVYLLSYSINIQLDSCIYYKHVNQM